jgi:hypothetical protein
MPVTDVGFFAFLITTFKDTLTTAADLLYPWVLGMLGFLLLLELIRVAWGIGIKDEHKVAAWAGYLIRFILLCLVIPRWEYFFTTVTTLGVNLGLHAGGNRIAQAQFLNPGSYLQLGVELGDILYQQWNASTITGAVQVALSPVMTAAYFLAWVVFLLAFFVMGLLIFMKQIEMAFALPALLVLLPFLAFGKTGWIGQGVVTYVVKLAYTFFLLALIASIVFPVAKGIALTTPDVRQALFFVFAAVTFVACFLVGPKMASNMMSGVFTLGAGSLANAALLGLHTATLATQTIQETTRRVVNTTGAVLREASGGAINVPTIPPAVGQGHLTQSLREGARHLHGS